MSASNRSTCNQQQYNDPCSAVRNSHRNGQERMSEQTVSINIKADMEDGSGGQTLETQLSTTSKASSSQVDSDIDPVVYVDLPEITDSSLCEPRFIDQSPHVIQDTILYDQFKNRMIQTTSQRLSDQYLTNTSTNSSSSSAMSCHSHIFKTAEHNMNTLPDSSGYDASTQTSQSPSEFRSVTVDDFNHHDDFHFSPLPERRYPDSPPPYSEMNVASRLEASSESVAGIPELQHTTIINNGVQLQAIIIPKHIFCHHCRTNVHSLVIKQNGFLTHCLGCLFGLFGLFPLVILLYWRNWCKYKYHYCPNCHKLIGYEIPFHCNKITLEE